MALTEIFFDFVFLHLTESKYYIELSYVAICCKNGFFHSLWQEKGESVCGRVIRSNMRLPYTALQAADRLFSWELREHAIDRLFSQFSSFISLPVALSDCLGRKPANLERWGVATAWTATL